MTLLTAADPSRMLTMQEAADRLGVTDRTIHTWTKRGLLPAFKIGAVVRYDPADLQRFIEDHKSPGKPLISGPNRRT